MTDRKPSDDLKDGLGLLFRAAKGATKELTPEKAEKVMREGGTELFRVISQVGRAMGEELQKTFSDEAPTQDAPVQPEGEAKAEGEAKGEGEAKAEGEKAEGEAKAEGEKPESEKPAEPKPEK